MKLIIAGSRQLESYKDHERVYLVADAITKSGLRPHVTEVVSGGARGIDLAGELWASAMSPPIPVKQFIPDWDGLGKRAGMVRNKQMAEYADALMLIWNGASRGSANMLQEAKKRNIRIYEYIVK